MLQNQGRAPRESFHSSARQPETWAAAPEHFPRAGPATPEAARASLRLSPGARRACPARCYRPRRLPGCCREHAVQIASCERDSAAVAQRHATTSAWLLCRARSHLQSMTPSPLHPQLCIKSHESTERSPSRQRLKMLRMPNLFC